MQANLGFKLYFKLKALYVIMSVVNILCGCSITSLPHDTQNSIGEVDANINNAHLTLTNAKNIQNNNFIVHTATGYFGHQSIVHNDTDFLPPQFSNLIQIDKQFYGLKSIAAGIFDLTRIPTVLDLSSNEMVDNCAEIRLTQQEGTLIDLLTMLGARCDLSWSYQNGRIILADTETRTWPVKGIPGDIQLQNQINNNSGTQAQSGATGGSIGAGGGGGMATGQSQATNNQSSVQNVAFNLQNSLWQNLQEAIKSILSRSGRLSISPSTSSLTVTDHPSVLLRVDRYMKQQNDILKRQVQIDVQILNVDVDAQDNYGINWGLVLKGAKGGFSINGQAVASGMSNGGSSFVPTNTTQAFTIGSTSGDISGSQLIINALSTINKNSLVTSTAVTTLSNQPVPVQFIDQLSYLASVQTTISGQSSLSQTALTPGQLTTGFSLNILPVIEADGRVNLQLSLNISALKRMAQYSTSGSTVQLPETLQRNFMQKVVIKSGDTFVVTGFDSDTQAIANSGVGSAYNWFFGGGVSANKARTRLVVLVTPRVIKL